MERLWQSVIDTADDISNVELIFYIDNDDEISLEKYEELNSQYSQVRHVTGERIVLSLCWNECWRISNGPYYMLCADDIVFSSESWDTILLQEFDKFPDKIVMVYGRDGKKDERLSTHPFLHKKWTDTLGYFAPPYFSSQMNDKWIFDIAIDLGRAHYVPEIFTEHKHLGKNRELRDRVYIEQIRRFRTDNIRQLYNNKILEREEAVRKLRNEIRDI